VIPLHDDNPTERPPIVTVSIIAICILVFFYQATLPGQPAEAFVFQYGAIPSVLFGHAQLPAGMLAIPAVMTLVTSMFLHGGWLHLIGNMLYLWVFGNNIEDVMGHGRFVVFYLLSGVIAASSHAITDSTSTIPMVGASGAISAVLGAYVLLFPRARVLVLVPAIGMIHVAAGIVLGMWFATQLISGGLSMRSQGGGVAFFAHIGGFVAGMALIGLFKRRDIRFFHRRIERSDE
jgi:membrane associated rhomboid family serine protease